jgi:hypothetical protein
LKEVRKFERFGIPLIAFILSMDFHDRYIKDENENAKNNPLKTCVQRLSQLLQIFPFYSCVDQAGLKGQRYKRNYRVTGL